MANLLINSLGNLLETSLATLVACGPMATISQTVLEKAWRSLEVAIIYYNAVNHIQMVSQPPHASWTAAFLVALLVVTTHSQGNTTALELNTITQVTLQPEFIYTYTITIDNPPNNTDLYFLVQSPSNDPLQQPFLDISTEDGYIRQCYSSADEFSGVCNIPTSELRNNLTLKAEIYCYVQCHLSINPQLSRRLRITLEDNPTFQAPSNAALPVELELQIPTGLVFTQIAIYARILNFKSVTSGVEFLANTGDAQTSIPDKYSYQVYGESIYWGGRGLFFSKQTVGAGQWIKIYLLIGPGMQISLSSTVMNGNDYNIELGKAYFDFTSNLEGKNYILNTTAAQPTYANKTLGIGFIIYAGDPTIEVSFDPNFTHVLSGRNTLGTVSYLLTALTRSTLNFTGVVYLRVRSSWNSDYYLYTEIDEASYIAAFPDVSYYSYVAAGEVYNYFFDDIIYTDDNETVRTYSLKIDMFAGSATFGVRRCREYEGGASFTSCLLYKTESFKNMTVLNSFYEIPTTLKRTETYVNLIFEYNLSKCEPVGNASSPIAHYCSFHVVAGCLGNVSAEFTISISKRRFASLLRQGQLSKDLLFKDEYLYYKLGLSSLEDILSITVFVTVIQGDIYLLASAEEEFPDFDTNQTKLRFSTSNSLTFHKQELTNNIYFSVYGIEFSEFTIGVSITRQQTSPNNSTNSTIPPTPEKTKTSLQMALSQEFTLLEGETTSSFLISTGKPMNITIQLIQLAGKVSMKVHDANGKAVSCRDESASNSKISCSLTTEANQSYELIVSGAADELQKFIILYYKQTHCTPYSLNMPLYVQVEGGESGCATFTLSKPTPLEVTSSLPLLHLLQQTLSFRTCIQDTCFDSSTAHHRLITKSELTNSCQLGNSKPEQAACRIRVEWSAAANATAVSFSLIVEEEGRDKGLFDGISAKVSSYDLSHSVGKYFYYPIYTGNTLKLFFTAFTSNSFYLAAHFVEQAQFVQNTTAVYLPYRETSYDLARSFTSNFYEAVVYGSNTNVFTIPAKVIAKYCKDCLLTISVYPIDSNAHSLSFFELEATQSETLLHPGDTKAGYLEQDEIYNYQLTAAGGDALLYIRDLSRESNNQKDCFSARLATLRDDSTTDVNGGFALLKKDSPLTNLYVEALEEVCSYEVSYSLVDTPLLTLTPNRQFTVQLRNRSTSYFLYTHPTNASFRIIEQVESGSSLIFATPVGSRPIQTLLKADPFDFAFVNTQKEGQFVIGNSSSLFVGAGIYLIAVRGDPAVNSELLVTDLTSSIPLSLNGILKEKLKKGSSRSYTFCSISAFNLTVSVDYGQLQLSIIDPNDALVHNSSISSSKTIAVPHNKQTEDFSFDFSSIFTRYTVRIEAQRDSSYSLKASKINITSRIFEGIPAYLTLLKDQPVLLEFLNLKSPLLNAGNTLNLLVDAIDIFGQEKDFLLTATASIEPEEGGVPQDMHINSITRSEDTFNLEIPLRVGSYYLSLTANRDALVTAILAKEALIHLKPSANAIMLREGVFQLFSDQKSAMIEVFTCWGDLSLAATDNYLDFAKRDSPSSEVVLEQNNYGGHFVVSAENIFGEYFVRVGSRVAGGEVGYLINYYFYDANDLLPYKLIDLPSREVTYALAPQALAFSLRPLTVKWALADAIKEVDVVYRLYVADNRNKVAQFANCRLGSVFTLSAAPADVTPQAVTFQLDLDALQTAVGDSETYFVSAQAIVNLIPAALADEDYPQTLRLIYDTVQLANVRPPLATASAYSTRLIVLWILLPFALAGLLLYCALKYCMEKYRGLLPNELMEEAGESEQQVADSAEKGSNASQSLKDEV